MNKIPKGYKQTEVGVIPGDWEVKKICDVAEVIGGGTPSTFTQKYWNGNINWFTPTEIGFNKYSYESLRKITEEGLKDSSAKLLPIGTILLTSRASIGDVSILKVPASTNQGFQSLIANENIDNEFLYYLISTLKNTLIKYASGSTFLEISPNKLKSIVVPLPPTRAEQTAIIIALNDADALITQLEKLIAKKRDIKQGAMQELLKPKEGWEVKKLGEIFKFLNTANNSRADLAESGDVEYIHYGDIHTRWNCFLDCSKNELPFIDKAKVNSVPFLENGDLVIADASEDYEGLATCVEIKNIGKRKIVAGLHTLLLRGDKNIIADGFKGYLRNYHGVKDALIRLSTGVSVFGISKTNLKEVEVSIPPTVEEQNRIIQILSDMDAEIEALEKKLEKYKAVKQGMMQELLTGKTRLIKENKV